MRPPRIPFPFVAALALAGLLQPRPLIAQGTESPHGTLSTALDCSACHTGDAWVPARDPLGFDHDRQTSFPLTGTHGELACSDCHLSLRFDEPKGPGGDCASCHVDVHLGTLGLDCTSCHDTESFTAVPGVEQHARTSFPLAGAHALISCEACHTTDRGGQYSGLDTSCFSCHTSDYASAIPDHAARGFPTECTDCHGVQAWRLGTTFDHAAEANGFELLGAHAFAACESCHVNPGNALRFPTPSGESDCITCHQADYDREHQGTQFPTECLQCHTRDNWGSADFDHALTGFALLGRHADIGCESCHGANNALLFPVPSGQDDCASCHQADYNRAHAGSGIPTTCADCHGTRSWEGAENFDHALTGFALVDPHGALVCDNCHRASDNQLLFPAPSSQDDCVACHRADYDQQHTGTSFPTTCLNCHAQTHWDGAVFDHLADTGFNLAAPHASLICEDCHRASDNQLLFPAPSSQDDCVACHRSDYDRVHAGTSFPTTCLDCHASTQWTGATFDHSVTGFDLVGTHTTLGCESCHRPSDNQLLFPTPSFQDDCVACHQTDYNTAHAGTGYPTTCLDCHNTTQFTGAVFDHNAFFPITSGAHVVAVCQDCHTVPGDASVFSCLTCHEHSQPAMDSKHASVGGYAYQSQACYNCHPDGKH